MIAPVDDLKRTRRQKAKPDPDRLPPHSIEAEQGVLGCILLAPECVDQCADLDAGAFYDLRHRTIYEALVAMQEGKVAIDLITVHQRLKDQNLLEGVSLPYLASLPDAVPSAANLEHYLEIVRRQHQARELVRTLTQTAAGIYDQPGSIDDALAQTERECGRIRALAGPDKSPSNTDVMRELVDEWERAANGETPPGIRTGIVDFDRWTGGVKPGQLVVFGARTSQGKSSLAMNIADHVAGTGQPVLFFSLEMPRKDLLHRAIAARARIDGTKLRDGKMTNLEIQRVAVAQAALAKAPLTIIDKGGLSISQVTGLARTITQREGTKLIVVDYLGKVSCDRGRSIYESVSYISGALKALAMELGVPVIAPHQLNRDNEREDREPRLSDFRDSGQIEQDADIAGLLHANPEDTGTSRRVKLIIAKHRGGQTGVINLLFWPAFTRFESVARIPGTIDT